MDELPIRICREGAGIFHASCLAQSRLPLSPLLKNPRAWRLQAIHPGSCHGLVLPSLRHSVSRISADVAILQRQAEKIKKNRRVRTNFIAGRRYPRASGATMLGCSRRPPEGYGVYACPTCKRELQSTDSTLRCNTCKVTYPIRDNIPDFILEDLVFGSKAGLSVLSPSGR
jgi:hypothetical protein